MVCILCRTDAMPVIRIFTKDSNNLNICKIITKYFGLKPNANDVTHQNVCNECWLIVENFHQLYERVSQAHQNLEDNLTTFNVSDQEQGDPIAEEIFFKTENTNEIQPMFEIAESPNFFDPEIKVEVNDLDLLPPIEIIEEKPNIRKLPQRITRRKQLQEDEIQSTILSKRIKIEPSVENDSNDDLPLAIFKNNETITEKRCRGRPKKIQENSKTLITLKNKVELPLFDESDNEDSNLMETPYTGTDDSDISSNTNDSDDSMPDVEPVEQFAVIPPKKKIVKPKKYNRRQKPLVPPKKLSREEINKKKSQQDEYEDVVLQFFGKYSCPKCSLLVKSFDEMRRHFRDSHPKETGYMLCCGRKFQLRKSLAEHIYVHWNPEHFKCKICNKVFQESRALEVHQLSHTNPEQSKDKKLFQCDKCPKNFTTKAAFEHHELSKHTPKSEFKFACPHCTKKYPTERKFKDHLKYTHDPESAIICDQCGIKVRTQSNLKKHHALEHSAKPRPTPEPMQCQICGTWLRHLAGLKQHMKTIHEDSKTEHRCHICDKISTNGRALKRHIYLNHICERKFKCTMCEKAFKRPQDLKEHTSTHTGEVLYTCPNCPMTFFSNANMYKHRQRLHRAEWEADRKKPLPPNIMAQATSATAAKRLQLEMARESKIIAPIII